MQCTLQRALNPLTPSFRKLLYHNPPKPNILEELVSAIKNPDSIPDRAISKFSWIDKDRATVEKWKAWEKANVPLTAADRPVKPVNAYIHNIKIGDDDEVSEAVRTVLSLKSANNGERIKAEKRAAREAWERRPGDSGSSEVQVASLTVRIENLHRHFKANHKDKHSRRGFEGIIVRRRKLLQYMKRKDFPMYRKMVLTLGLMPVRDSNKKCFCDLKFTRNSLKSDFSPFPRIRPCLFQIFFADI
eukprot:CAMPEP_0171465678 /NCGR_PEP_ID=MMETSP0945-20130129/8683_1 /TAXON_ID=109269 /ORGANISM="Vaucheria litorea, Strain CCMP2940" /LENGTH=244 /DNA_ID=CAMNT_0011993379 /DNA_START=21 /DNA_END=755 /DNA_ORIENTATION=-